MGKVDNAIDLGCGIGRHTIELVRRNVSAVGVDYSQRHIDYARKKCIENGIVEATGIVYRKEQFKAR